VPLKLDAEKGETNFLLTC